MLSLGLMRKSLLDKPRPVWHNRDVSLYSVRLQRKTDAAKLSVFVLTQSSVIAAKDMAAHAANDPNMSAVGAQLIKHPLISPSIGEIQQVLDNAGKMATPQANPLKLFEVRLASPEHQDLRVLVWSTMDNNDAAAFAAGCFPYSKALHCIPVAQPIVVGTSEDVDQVAANG